MAFFINGVETAGSAVFGALSCTSLTINGTLLTATAGEINQALDGIGATVIPANLNALTGGAETALHGHAAYALLAGRSGGQVLNMGLDSGDDGEIHSTVHGTKGTLTLGSTTEGLFVHEDLDRVSVGTTLTNLTVLAANVNSCLTQGCDDDTVLANQVWFRASDTATYGALTTAARARGTLAAPTVVANGDLCMSFDAVAYDGSDFGIIGRMIYEVDGAPGNNDTPGRIRFLTTPDASDIATETFRLSADKEARFAGALRFTADPVGLNPDGSLTVTIPDAGAAATHTFNVVSNQIDDAAGLLADFNMAVAQTAVSQIWFKVRNAAVNFIECGRLSSLNYTAIQGMYFVANVMNNPAAIVQVKEFNGNGANVHFSAAVNQTWRANSAINNAASVLAYRFDTTNTLNQAGALLVSVQNNTAVKFTIDKDGIVNVAAGGSYSVNGTKVVGARKTGWATATGTATRTTFDTASVTLPQLAQRVKALIDDFHATAGHGLIGT